ncbi:hypothetical protein ARAM_004377 [Aspergillus rambellii]|uniref:Zn(2)-C6 fungal-type domain-containing protein n=1 Tax=Aspergillus rambellii TaxID=308745 RepID=A0A0F8VMR7_9EURO|nr:hypothetical protein ARAM_004377 [Aspergillus rambellii]
MDDTQSPSSIDPSPSRKRKRTACQGCRDRRVKCDNGRPACQSCQKVKLPCVYPDEDGPGSASRYDPGSVEILQQLRDIRAILDLVYREQKTQSASSPSAHQTQTHRHPQSILGSSTSHSTPVAFSSRPAGIHHCSEYGSSIRSVAGERPPLVFAGIGAESLLRWPRVIEILGSQIPTQSFVLEYTVNTDEAGCASTSERSRYGIREDDFLPLCRRFLNLVHVRNPILEPSDMEQYAKEASENGLKWDAKSCLVLLACALGCLASPGFTEGSTLLLNPVDDSLPKDHVEYERAEAYFQAASKRIGYLGTGLPDIQCLYLAGIYEKHMLRILQAWFWTQQSCARLHAYLLCKGTPVSRVDGSSQNDHRLEQRLYWSCIKAESEFMRDIPLPRSALIELKYPDSFPSPPLGPSRPDESKDTADSRDGPLSENEERSWLFYLAELALRRTLDQALPLFYVREGPTTWLQNIDYIVKQSSHVEEQLDIWYNHLPPAIQPDLDPDISPDDQLPFFLQGRLMGAREAIYRPALYYILHHNGRGGADNWSAVLPLAIECVRLTRAMIKHYARHKRHGGIWFALRAVWTQSIIILATVNAGIDYLEPPADWPELVRMSLQMLQQWGSESADIRSMYDVLVRAFLATTIKLGIREDEILTPGA